MQPDVIIIPAEAVLASADGRTCSTARLVDRLAAAADVVTAIEQGAGHESCLFTLTWSNRPKTAQIVLDLQLERTPKAHSSCKGGMPSRRIAQGTNAAFPGKFWRQ